MKKILWLASWYPNKTDMFTGDFIQRHAQAASLYNQIIVLHVAKAPLSFFSERIHEEINKKENLTEHIVYFKCNISFKPLNRMISMIRYYLIFKKLILRYLKEEYKPDLVHVHVPVKAGLLAIWLNKKYKLQYVLTEHYCIYNNILEEQFKNKALSYKLFTKKIIKKAAVFSTVSENTGESINKMVVMKPFTVIYNVVDTSLFYYRSFGHNKIRFIHVSNLSFQKNIEGILKTFAMVGAQNEQVELMIVGKCDQQIFDFAKSTGLLNKTFFFRGEVSYAEVAHYMQSSHSLIMFSRAENMPCVILEALCCGLPVITSKVGGIPEVINPSNGILVASEDEVALRQAILEMIEKYGLFNREAISKEAIGKFSYEIIGKQINELYHRLISRQPY
jgi:glycosyltransferase involved in cell wall biosynthesis